MQYIEIDGQTYPIKYGFSVIRRFMAKYKLKKLMDLAQLPALLEMDDLPAFVHAGLETGARVDGNKTPFTVAEVEELLDIHLWLSSKAFEAFAQDIQPPAQESLEPAGPHSDEGKN